MSVEERKADPSSFITGTSGDFEVVIGIEAHAQIASKSKLFSGAATAFGAAPNSQVSFVDAAMPGMLPVLNEECVKQAIRTGLALHAKINLFSAFDRKNYFYPDLPQGYQISQFYHPIVGEGRMSISLGPTAKGEFKEIEIGIERLHLEQDAGKSLHDQHPAMSFVDLNRCGIGLMEIVSKPDLRSAEEAKAYLTKLRMILRYLGVCDGNMDEGSLRADVNVSVRRPGEALGTRCEIKNVNSIRFVGQAIEYEARRQIELIENGKSVEQETRLFDPQKGETRSMRSKEEAEDYRYFPEPDLPALQLEQSFVDELAKTMPKLPDTYKKELQELGLSSYDAAILISEKSILEYFLRAVQGQDAKLVANWVINELLGALNKAGLDITQSPISAERLSGLVGLIKAGVISGKIAKDVFEIMWKDKSDAGKIVEEHNLQQVTDIGQIEQIVTEVLQQNPEQLRKAKEKPALAGWFVGQVMKKTNGKANPEVVNKLVKEKLELE